MTIRLGTLELAPYDPDLVAPPVAAALDRLPDLRDRATTVEIDPDLADTAALAETYGLEPQVSANCVVVLGRRAGEERAAACVVLSHTRADVNHLVKRTLEVRKVSFAPREWAVDASGMEFGGITPIGLPESWSLFVDRAVLAQPWVIVGSGLRRSKLALPGAALADLPGAVVLDGLGLVPDA